MSLLQISFSEFPQPGDIKKHLLPILIDHEAVNQQNNVNDNEHLKDKVVDTQLKEFWMPDRFCKVCYGCEESFTMYRRRHHCRMCGQIFCNNCSSFYIDGMLFNIPGLVRACRLCYDQLFERNESENKLARRKLLEKMSIADSQDSSHSALMRGAAPTQSLNAQNANRSQEHSDMHKNNTSLQNR
jgi:1-phosphatidylinositol-3-phosphate 5-kinase